MENDVKYDVNYDDERFTQVETQKNAALSELEKTYGGMVNQTDKYYNDQIQASKDWAETQKQNQQAQTDFTIEKIEQEKEKANKDYLKEQSGAYVDWQKQSNQYGANAEQMASQGMTNTGYSESSQVAMYNQYQNRVATAREAFANATLQYNNAIKEAQLQNNSILAEIAAEAYQKQLELALQAFQYKNSLTMDLVDKKMQTQDRYYQRQQDVLAQINREHALAEEVRQFNKNQEFQAEQAKLDREFKAIEAQKDRDFQAAENAKSRENKVVYVDQNGNEVDFTDGSGKVSTEYYQGDLNPDANEFGTFENGYQPKGIKGHGAVKKTGSTYQFETETKYGPGAGKKKTVVQNVWQAEDGTLWYWEGRENKYIQLG